MGRDGPPPCGRCVQNAHVYGSSCDSNATAVDDTSDSETDDNSDAADEDTVSGLEKRDDLDAADTSYGEAPKSNGRVAIGHGSKFKARKCSAYAAFAVTYF